MNIYSDGHISSSYILYIAVEVAAFKSSTWHLCERIWRKNGRCTKYWSVLTMYVHVCPCKLKYTWESTNTCIFGCSSYKGIYLFYLWNQFETALENNPVVPCSTVEVCIGISIVSIRIWMEKMLLTRIWFNFLFILKTASDCKFLELALWIQAMWKNNPFTGLHLSTRHRGLLPTEF